MKVKIETLKYPHLELMYPSIQAVNGVKTWCKLASYSASCCVSGHVIEADQNQFFWPTPPIYNSCLACQAHLQNSVL